MDRITVQPTEVRGLGDILSPKSSSDFEEYLSTLSSGTDTVNGASMTVYTLAYASNVASVSLTSNKSILSYADSESATLSATVLDSDSEPLEGVSVEFFKGSTSLGTADTNSSGVATKTYSSTGAGDLSFTAKVGSLVSETYVIEDCYYWNATGISYTSTSTTDRRVLSGLEDVISYTPTGKFEFSFDLQDTNNNGSKRLYLISKGQSTSTTNYYGLGANEGSSNNQMVVRTTSTSISSATPKTNPATFKFVRDGDTVTMYHNSSVCDTKTLDWIDTYAPYTLSWGIWQTGTVTATNIKIKRL